MVDVGDKAKRQRSATASGFVNEVAPEIGQRWP